jgi:hypothetical protein
MKEEKAKLEAKEKSLKKKAQRKEEEERMRIR